MDDGKPRAVVLVVEDDHLLRRLMVDYLEDSGFEVLSAEHADKAIKFLAARVDIKVIITDVDMPGSMDGLRLAHAVRNRWPPIHILVTSGHRWVQEKELPSGSRFFFKPYRFDQLVEAVTNLA